MPETTPADRTADAAAFLRTLVPADCRPDVWPATARCLLAAADEIERLRDEVAAANSRVIYLETELHG